MMMRNKIMKEISIVLSLVCILGANSGEADSRERSDHHELNSDVMSPAYWELWNPEVLAKIDQDIEKYRKADAVLNLEAVSEGTVVEVEQLCHDFVFGANIFNFNQLGSQAYNRKYKAVFGELFNSATIPFYWKNFELEANHPRFREEYRDTEEYWNKVEAPKLEPHWRRPATDPIVVFCEENGIRRHGHPMIWGIRTWHHPEWIFEQFCPEEEKMKLSKVDEQDLESMSPQTLADLAPEYFANMQRLFKKRILELCNQYGDRIDSWDVVNESAVDYHGECVTGDAICKSYYGFMPGDYAYEAFRLADDALPKSVGRFINDWANDENYVNQVKDLIAHGCRIDVVGSQMHLFEPQQCSDIAAGKLIESPQQVWDKMDILSKAGLPIHLSEITITSPGDDAEGREIQAIITRNLYRLWFSIEKMMGITWWNVVDGCGAPGEPAISGIFTRNMEPKPAFFALNELINQEWLTKTTVVVDKNHIAKFRGFKGRYRISWIDENQNMKRVSAEIYLKNNGDGVSLLQ